MGRAGNSGLSHGTPTNPQQSLEQLVYESVAQAIEDSIYHDTLVDESLLDELESDGAKLNRADVQFVTRDATGQIVWLESGGPSAGLEHILHGNGRTPGYAGDFARAFGLEESEVAGYLHTVISRGIVVSDETRPIGSGGRIGFKRVYYYEGDYHVVTGIGTNGFIVSAYPVRRR